MLDRRWSLPVRNRSAQINSGVSDRIGARSSSHLLIDEPFSQYQLQNRAAEPNGMSREQILPSLDKDNARDFDFSPNSSVGVPGRPLVSHLLPQSADRKAKRPLPGPAHVHVAALVLDVLADDIAAQAVSRTMAGLIGLDPDHGSPMEGLPL